MLRQRDVIDLVRWQANRWLTGVCGLLSCNAADTSDGQVRMSSIKQHSRASMLDVLLSCLRMEVNSSSHTLLNRTACRTYYRKEPQRRRNVRVHEEADKEDSDVS